MVLYFWEKNLEKFFVDNYKNVFTHSEDSNVDASIWDITPNHILTKDNHAWYALPMEKKIFQTLSSMTLWIGLVLMASQLLFLKKWTTFR